MVVKIQLLRVSSFGQLSWLGFYRNRGNRGVLQPVMASFLWIQLFTSSWKFTLLFRLSFYCKENLDTLWMLLISLDMFKNLSLQERKLVENQYIVSQQVSKSEKNKIQYCRLTLLPNTGLESKRLKGTFKNGNTAFYSAGYFCPTP